MPKQTNVRVRFAPSPTGNLHIGGLRTALFNWLFARHNDGSFLLRIEDTDTQRSTQEYQKSILQSFAWTHLEYDEPLVIQSERIGEHQKVAHNLIEAGKAYRCFCSPEEVAARYGKATEGDFFVMYDGHCRNRTPQPDDDMQQHVIRFKLPDDIHEISFNDLIKGPITFHSDQLDDFIIIRSGGFPMYNFVVVVDDAFMRITHIIRGEEHIVNTPKQILLYQACGYKIPEFAHLPLILGPSGDKLSKRDGATSVIEYRKEGYCAPALLNYLARLGWSHGDQEIFSMSELIEYFSLEHIGKKGAVFDFEKLAWVNSIYIKNMSSEEIVDAIINDVDTQFISYFTHWNIDSIKRVIELYKERVKTLKMMVDEVLLVYNGPQQKYNQEDLQKWITPDFLFYKEKIIAELEKLTDFTHDTCTQTIKKLAAELNIKLVQLLQPIRLALIGKSSGPGIFDLLAVIGKDESIKRLSALY